MTLWSRNSERRSNAILPILSGDVSSYKPSSTKKSLGSFDATFQARRTTRRNWIWIVLGVNIVAAIGFMMLSAYYYIPTSEQSGILEDVLHQSDLMPPSRGEVSILEEREEHHPSRVDHPEGAETKGTDTQTTTTVFDIKPPVQDFDEELRIAKGFNVAAADRKHDNQHEETEREGERQEKVEEEEEAEEEEEKPTHHDLENQRKTPTEIEFKGEETQPEAVDEEVKVVLPETEEEDKLLQQIQDQLDTIAAHEVIFKEEQDGEPDQQEEKLQEHHGVTPAEQDHKHTILEEHLSQEEHTVTDEKEQSLLLPPPPPEEQKEAKEHPVKEIAPDPPSEEDVNNLFVMPGRIEELLKRLGLNGLQQLLGLAHSPDEEEGTTIDTQTSPAQLSEPVSETVPLAQPPTKDLPPSPETIQELLSHLTLWLKADAGVQVVDEIECRESGNLCEVTSWTSQVQTLTGDTLKFFPDISASPDTRPVLIPDVQNGLPAMYFTCPLINSALRLYDYMTLFIVLSPASLLPGDTYKAQKFFGNSPEGQFLFHGGKPAFYSSGGLQESDELVENGEFILLSYRLQSSLEIRVNGKPQKLSRDGPTGDAGADGGLRFSTNDHVSLGHVQRRCDLNAFQGRIAELLVCDTPLSDDKLHAVESYLARKWWSSPILHTEMPTSKVELTISTDNGHDNGEIIIGTQPPVPPDQDETTISTNNGEGKGQSHVFDPEDNVFEWVPSDEIFQKSSQKRRMENTLVSEWQKEVEKRITAIRNYNLGGEVLREFIHERKEELLELRERLFG